MQNILTRIRSWLASFWSARAPNHHELIPAVVDAGSSDPEVAPATMPESVDSSVIRKRISRHKIADAASGILERFENLHLTNLEKGSHAGDSRLGLENLLGCDFHLIGDAVDEDSLGIDERTVFNPRTNAHELADMHWPIDIAVIVQKDNGYYMQRVVTATAQQLRGQTRIVPQKSIIVYCGMLLDDGTWWAERRIAGFINGRWVRLDKLPTVVKGGLVRTFVDDADPDSLDLSVGIALSMALTERYHWHVAFGAESGPRLLLPTSSDGASRIFKDREKRPDETRRSALRHWVENHFRSTTENITYVRDHLRGATRFVWKEIECELMVSAFDLEKNEFFRDRAASWRASRKHNSVKVRLKKAVS